LVLGFEVLSRSKKKGGGEQSREDFLGEKKEGFD
jgi:hypothetical protein